MKNIRYRLWCKKCKDFTIHNRVYKDEMNNENYNYLEFSKEKEYTYVCKCNLQHTPMEISEIPEIKIREQRERYKKYKLNQLDLYTSFIKEQGLNDIFNSNFSNCEIIESDAGYRAEEKWKREKHENEKKEAEFTILQFKNLNRNDKCICGTNKKYKKCCLEKVNSLKIKFKL